MLPVLFRAKSVTFDDSRLRMTFAGRLLVRAMRTGTLVILCALALVGFMTDVLALQAGSVLIALFLGERLLYRKTADSSLAIAQRQVTPNLAPLCTPAAYSVIEKAYDAHRVGKQTLSMALLAQLTRETGVRTTILRTDADIEALLAEGIDPADMPLTQELLQSFLSRVVAGAADAARDLGDPDVAPEHLLLGLLLIEDPLVMRAATRAQLTVADVFFAIRASREARKPIRHLPRVVPHHVMNRAWTSRPTPLLDSVAADLTDYARVGGITQLIGHEEHLETVLETLAKPSHPHVLLVAPAAGGKETLVGEVARRIAQTTAPGPLLDRRLVRLDVSELLTAAGSEPTTLVKRIADEILAAGNILLYVPDFDRLVHGGGDALAVADILLPILSADTFPVIAATTPEAFARILETRGDITGTFQVVRLETLSIDAVTEVLAHQTPALERRYGVLISVGALRSSATLAARYLAPARPVPGSALDLLGEAAVAVRESGEKRVTHVAVERVLEKQIQIPLGEATAEEADALVNLEQTLGARVLGQEMAVSALSESIRARRAGMASTEAPASFLFVGPTGVGKTELAKAVSAAVYGENHLTRLDMSEFAGADSITRLLGTSTAPGALTEPVRVSPRQLVLLDEFEKAAPEAIKLLLQVLSDGRLTDGMGRVISFADTFVIATSNAQSAVVRDALRQGEHVAAVEGYVREKLSETFPTELLNRFTRIIIFRDLNPEQLRQIAGGVVKTIAALLEEKHGIFLTVDDAALGEMVRTGYDPQWGARPIRRAVESALDSVVAPEILRGALVRGSSVTVTFTEGRYALVH